MPSGGSVFGHVAHALFVDQARHGRQHLPGLVHKVERGRGRHRDVVADAAATGVLGQVEQQLFLLGDGELRALMCELL